MKNIVSVFSKLSLGILTCTNILWVVPVYSQPAIRHVKGGCTATTTAGFYTGRCEMKTFWSGDALIVSLEPDLTLTNLSFSGSPDQIGDKIEETIAIRLHDFQSCKNTSIKTWTGSMMIPYEDYPSCMGDEYNFSEDSWEEGGFVTFSLDTSERGTPQVNLYYGRGLSLTYQGDLPIPGK